MNENLNKKHIEPFNNLYNSYPFVKDVLKDKKHIETTKDIEKYYSKLMNQYHQQFNHSLYSNLALSEGMKILNVGSLFGFDEKNLHYLYNNLNLKMYGIDISKIGIYFSQSNKPAAQYAVAYAESLPFPDNCFDLVFSREVIEHVISPEDMMKEIYRVLKPGGKAVITTPNADSLNLGHILDKFNKKFGTHIWEPVTDYKDDHLTLKRILPAFREFKLIKRVYDGNFYFMLSQFKNKKIALAIFKLTQFINKLPVLNRMFCDQVKYVLNKQQNEDNSVNEISFVEPVTMNKLDAEYFCKESNMYYFNEKLNTPDFIPEEETIETEKQDKPILTTKCSLFQDMKDFIYFFTMFVFYILIFITLLPISLVLKFMERLK